MDWTLDLQYIPPSPSLRALVLHNNDLQRVHFLESTFRQNMTGFRTNKGDWPNLHLIQDMSVSKEDLFGHVQRLWDAETVKAMKLVDIDVIGWDGSLLNIYQ